MSTLSRFVAVADAIDRLAAQAVNQCARAAAALEEQQSRRRRRSTTRSADASWEGICRPRDAKRLATNAASERALRVETHGKLRTLSDSRCRASLRPVA